MESHKEHGIETPSDGNDTPSDWEENGDDDNPFGEREVRVKKGKRGEAYLFNEGGQLTDEAM